MPLAPLPGGKPDVRFISPSADISPNEIAMAKHAIKAQDPAIMPHQARRNVVADRGGAAHTVSVSVAPGIAPEAGQVLHAGRILPSAVNRSSVFEFSSGEQEGY